ncbi:hypothetical protein CVA01_06120 [Corynebacterium variabile]|uniref:Uncharacterized protein n=1 Tax=Corynebacterium variabile TaxID=1727 RepID=A0A4Y4BXT9_9CORY|nr:hypothetical protein CVA01_06120 [Corynebacterium variabile]
MSIRAGAEMKESLGVMVCSCCRFDAGGASSVESLSTPTGTTQLRDGEPVGLCPDPAAAKKEKLTAERVHVGKCNRQSSGSVTRPIVPTASGGNADAVPHPR